MRGDRRAGGDADFVSRALLLREGQRAADPSVHVWKPRRSAGTLREVYGEAGVLVGISLDDGVRRRVYVGRHPAA